MLLILTFIVTINCIIAYDIVPTCVSCKWFIPNIKGNNELGLCKMFKETYYHKSKEMIQYSYAAHCRRDENLCGKLGYLYDSINSDSVEISYEKDLNDEYEELKNRCCGEVNEKNELDQLEKDFLEIFQKIKRHNKKKIYEAGKDLYKLFRRRDIEK
jgi:hypothetical protein